MCIRQSDAYNHCSHTINTIIECEEKVTNPAFKCKLLVKGNTWFEWCPACEIKRKVEEEIKREKSLRGKFSRFFKKEKQDESPPADRSSNSSRKLSSQDDNQYPLLASVGRDRPVTSPEERSPRDPIPGIGKSNSVPVGQAAIPLQVKEYADPKTITPDKIAYATAKLFQKQGEDLLVQYPSGNTEYFAAGPSKRRDTSERSISDSRAAPRGSVDQFAAKIFSPSRSSYQSATKEPEALRRSTDYPALRAISTPRGSLDDSASRNPAKPRVVSGGSEIYAKEYTDLIGSPYSSPSPKPEEEMDIGSTHVPAKVGGYREQLEWERMNNGSNRPSYSSDSPQLDNFQRGSSRSKWQAMEPQQYYVQESTPPSQTSPQSKRQAMAPQPYRPQESPSPDRVSSQSSQPREQEISQEADRARESPSLGRFDRHTSYTMGDREQYSTSHVHPSPLGSRVESPSSHQGLVESSAEFTSPSRVSSQSRRQEREPQANRYQTSPRLNTFDRAPSSPRRPERQIYPTQAHDYTSSGLSTANRVPSSSSGRQERERPLPPLPQGQQHQIYQSQKTERDIEFVGKRISPNLPPEKVEFRNLPTAVNRRPQPNYRRPGVEDDKMSMITTFSAFIPEPISQNAEVRREGSRLKDGTFDHRRLAQERPKKFITKPDPRDQSIDNSSRSPRGGIRSPGYAKVSDSPDSIEERERQERPLPQWPLASSNLQVGVVASMTESHRPSEQTLSRTDMREVPHEEGSGEWNESEHARPVTQQRRSDREQTYGKQYPAHQSSYRNEHPPQHRPFPRYSDQQKHQDERGQSSTGHSRGDRPSMGSLQDEYGSQRYGSQRNISQQQDNSSSQSHKSQSPHLSTTSTTYNLTSTQNANWKNSPTLHDEIQRANEKARWEGQPQGERAAEDGLRRGRYVETDRKRADSERLRIEASERKKRAFLDDLKKADETVARFRDVRGYVDYSHNRHPDDKGRPPPPPPAGWADKNWYHAKE